MDVMSLDAAMDGDTDSRRDSAQPIARRNVSIFSRRGTNSPRPLDGEGKPRLWVTIPNKKDAIIRHHAISTILHSKPQRSMEADDATPMVVSKFASSPRSTKSDPSKDSPRIADLTSPAAQPQQAPEPADPSEGNPNSRNGSSDSRSSELSKTTTATSVETATDGASVKDCSRPTSRSSAASANDNASSTLRPKSYQLNKPLPPVPARMNRHSAPGRPPQKVAAHGDKKIHSTTSMRVPRTHAKVPRHSRSSQSMTQLDLCDEEFMQTAPFPMKLPPIASPTLSEAELDLQNHLPESHPGEKNEEAEPAAETDPALDPGLPTHPPTGAAAVTVRRAGSVHSVMNPPERAPTLPKRSRKREWKPSKASRRPKRPPVPDRRKSDFEVLVNGASKPVKRSASAVERIPPVPALKSIVTEPAPGAPDTAEAADTSEAPPSEGGAVPGASGDPADPVPDLPDHVEPVDAVRPGTPDSISTDSDASVSSTSAEDVLLKILSSLLTKEDLFNTAVMNKGMYRVYKENELYLLKAVTYNQSPAEWEFREWSPPDDQDGEAEETSSLVPYTAKSYLRYCRRDMAVIDGLKQLIVENCQTSIRRNTTAAITNPAHSQAQRFDNAFWRIWSFCKAFGSNKGREDDLTGQLDWLKGGLLANSQGCGATVDVNVDFEITSILLNAPDHFAMGNHDDGLAAGLLFDITEIWTCMGVLLQPYQECAELGWEYGVFDECDVKEGDDEMEQQLLEEWTAFLLTLGPAVVLEMARHAAVDISLGFQAARDHGWTKWSPPLYEGSRINFLKEPASRLFQLRVTASRLQLRDPREDARREENRRRVASLAAEIRVQRQASSFKRRPLIDMDTERPMSMTSRASSVRSAFSQRSVSMRVGTSFSGYDPTPIPVPGIPSRFIGPIDEDDVESFSPTLLNRHSADNIVKEQAIPKLIRMGIPAAQVQAAMGGSTTSKAANVEAGVDALLAQG